MYPMQLLGPARNVKIELATPTLPSIFLPVPSSLSIHRSGLNSSASSPKTRFDLLTAVIGTKMTWPFLTETCESILPGSVAEGTGVESGMRSSREAWRIVAVTGDSRRRSSRCRGGARRRQLEDEETGSSGRERERDEDAQ